MKFEKSAGAVVYKRDGNETYFLLLEFPSMSVKNPHNIWSFPKGRIEDGENEVECAFREVKEETGLSDLKLVDGFKTAEHYLFKREGDYISKTTIYFLMEAVGVSERVTISAEHTDSKWAIYIDACKLVKIKTIKDTLTKANEFLLTGPAQAKLL